MVTHLQEARIFRSILCDLVSLKKLFATMRPEGPILIHMTYQFRLLVQLSHTNSLSQLYKLWPHDVAGLPLKCSYSSDSTWF
jgi:hypothetical protein